MTQKRRPRKRSQASLSTAGGRPEEPKPPEPAQHGVAKFLRRPRAWLLSGIAAIIIAALILFRDAVLGEFFRKDAIGDSIREVEGKPAIQVVRIERFKMDDENWQFVHPKGDTLSHEDEKVIQNVTGTNGAAKIITQAEATGVPVEKATWRIFLRGGRNQGVRILDMRLADLKRGSPLGGTLFDIPPQGAADTELMGVNGDEIQPVVRKLMVTGGGIDSYLLGRPYFQDRTINLTDREEQILMLRAVTKKYDLSFSLEVDYQVGDQKLSAVLTDNGKPFHLTAYNCRNGELNYQHYYSLQSRETYGVYPDKPDWEGCR